MWQCRETLGDLSDHFELCVTWCDKESQIIDNDNKKITIVNINFCLTCIARNKSICRHSDAQGWVLYDKVSVTWRID